MYRNSEGYSDPTAGAALGQVMKDYKKERRKIWQKQNELKVERDKSTTIIFIYLLPLIYLTVKKK